MASQLALTALQASTLLFLDEPSATIVTKVILLTRRDPLFARLVLRHLISLNMARACVLCVAQALSPLFQLAKLVNSALLVTSARSMALQFVRDASAASTRVLMVNRFVRTVPTVASTLVLLPVPAFFVVQAALPTSLVKLFALIAPRPTIRIRRVSLSVCNAAQVDISLAPVLLHACRVKPVASAAWLGLCNATYARQDPSRISLVSRDVPIVL